MARLTVKLHSPGGRMDVRHIDVSDRLPPGALDRAAQAAMEALAAPKKREATRLGKDTPARTGAPQASDGERGD